MVKGRRASGVGKPGSFLICLGVSGGTILLLSMVGAAIAAALDDPTGNLGLISLAVMLISAAVSGVFSTRMKGEGGLPFSALVALTVVLIMLLINVIVCAGKVSLGAFMNYLCYLGVAVMAAFLGKKRDKHRRRKH